ncbi:hypothetical protein FOZ63_017268, partial [Perkinsus olseni]
DEYFCDDRMLYALSTQSSGTRVTVHSEARMQRESYRGDIAGEVVLAYEGEGAIRKGLVAVPPSLWLIRALDQALVASREPHSRSHSGLHDEPELSYLAASKSRASAAEDATILCHHLAMGGRFYIMH